MKSFGLFLCLTLSAFFAFSQKKAGKTQPIIEVQVSANRTIVRDDNTINGYGFGGGLNIIGSKDRFLNFNFGFDINKTTRVKKEFYAPSGKVGNSTRNNETVTQGTVTFSGQFRYYFESNKNIFIEQGIFIGLPLDIGLLGGLGFIIPVKGIELTIKPSYVYGGDISVFYGPGDPTPIYNQFVKLSIGIRLLDFFKP
jgi:hypothetical protein|tara:strand:- start:36 stop:626 length:591 start_codon:yes stop_codon:yes gene_type:complete